MTTCKIQWIDRFGRPTPDENPAVGTATSIITHTDGSSSVRSFPICERHAAVAPWGKRVYLPGEYGTLCSTEWKFEAGQ